MSQSRKGISLLRTMGVRNQSTVAGRLDAYAIPEPNSGCFIWIGALSDGYGLTTVGAVKKGAHVAAFEAVNGPVPDGMVLDHKCRVRCCVNPDHLEPVTNLENLLRGHGHAARNKAKTHCPRGHEYAGDNLHTTPSNKRRCRECQRVAARLRPSRAKSK